MSHIRVLTADMPPELLIAAFPFDRLARLPLLLRHPFEMAIAVLIKSVVRSKAGVDDRAMLPVLHNLGGVDGFALQEVNGGSLLAQDQSRAFLLPSLLSPTQLKIPASRRGVSTSAAWSVSALTSASPRAAVHSKAVITSFIR
jgi:hypothetical protein